MRSGVYNKHLDDLINQKESICISLYLPINRFGLNPQKNHIRFKGIVRKARDKILAKGMTYKEAEKFLYGAVNNLSEDELWSNASRGLAVFISHNMLKYFHLPFRVDETVIVDNKFYIVPLIKLFEEDAQYYILGLSQNGARLYKGSPEHLEEIEIKDIHTNMTEALGFDTSEKPLQFHGAVKGGSIGRRGGSVIFHGGDSFKNFNKNLLINYFRIINKNIYEYLKPKERPLILAGAKHLLPIYKQINTYKNTTEEGIVGNPEKLGSKELNKKARGIVKSYLWNTFNKIFEKYKQRLTRMDLKQILPFCQEGRVEYLFINPNIKTWGFYDTNTHEIIIDKKETNYNEDLLNLAVYYTLINGGNVFTLNNLKILNLTSMTAILRY